MYKLKTQVKQSSLIRIWGSNEELQFWQHWFLFQLELRDRNDRLHAQLQQLHDRYGNMASVKTDLSAQILSNEEEKLKVMRKIKFSVNATRQDAVCQQNAYHRRKIICCAQRQRVRFLTQYAALLPEHSLITVCS